MGSPPLPEDPLLVIPVQKNTFDIESMLLREEYGAKQALVIFLVSSCFPIHILSKNEISQENNETGNV